MIAARRYRSRMGHAVFLALVCLPSFLTAGAQSLSASPPDLHQLQQQVATLTVRVNSTSYLVTALLLLPIAVACLVLWWNARRFRAFGSVGMYLLMVSALFYADFLRSDLWDAVFSSLASLFIVEMAADALHIPKHRWIGAVRLVCLAGVAVCWVHRLQWLVLVPIDLSSFAVLVLLIVRVVRPIRQARLILPAIAIIFLFRLPLDPTIHPLAPYRNGDEIAIEAGLPLGVTPDAEYPESTFPLTPGDSLTFLSDGVVEAQSSTGELFGFDRTRAISTQSADNIARAAQAHGQQDDITVLTLQFSPAEVLHA